MLLLIGFLIGFVPLYVWHRAVKWRHNRRLSQIERTPPVVMTPPAPAAGPASAFTQTPTPSPTGDPFQDD